MIPRQAIILAGGLGTRLRDAVPDLPKCMAPVAGRPFLFQVINALRREGIEKFIFSLGYKHELIERYLQDEFHTLDYQCAIEAEPLGTGGAIQLACQKATEENVLVVNGDTLFRASLPALSACHEQGGWTCTLALKPMKNFDRYGAVILRSDGRVTEFNEKKLLTEGLINGGVYLLHVPRFLDLQLPVKFSFEQDFLEKEVRKGMLGGIAQNAYFIDIGIPEDYQRAQVELSHAPLDLKSVHKDWTLLLDRDGVLNHDKPGSYIFSPEEYLFMDGVPEAMRRLSSRFHRIIITTNQRGVGRGLLNEDTLAAINQRMLTGVEAAGGRIDAVYCATADNNHDPFRKPNPGMARRALEEFPDIDPDRTIMVGNNISDMQFGRNAGVYTVFLTTTNPDIRLPHPDIDLLFPSLPDFAKAL